MTFVSATATNANGSTSEFGPVCGDPLHTGKVSTADDGICDDWKLNGIDYNGDGFADLPLNTMGADPKRKDMFVEADYMVGFKPKIKLCRLWSMLSMWRRCRLRLSPGVRLGSPCILSAPIRADTWMKPCRMPTKFTFCHAAQAPTMIFKIKHGQ